MKIKWFGHSCFLITTASGTKILTDPFDPSVGYAVPKVEADIVTISHDHHDHNYVQAVTGEFTHIHEPGHYSEQGVDITGVSTFHDDAQGSQRGPNVIFTFRIDGLTVCHCGDLGHLLSDEQVRQIGNIDVLLVPVGGCYTIDAVTAAQVSKQLKAAVIIPMHFKTSVVDFPITGIHTFIDCMGGGDILTQQEIEIEPQTFRQLNKVVVLSYQ